MSFATRSASPSPSPSIEDRFCAVVWNKETTVEALVLFFEGGEVRADADGDLVIVRGQDVVLVALAGEW